MSARYRVHPIPAATEEEHHCHFDVAGPDVNYFARQHTLATIMQRALNRRELSAVERKALRRAIGFVLAGEREAFTLAEEKALERAQEKLS